MKSKMLAFIGLMALVLLPAVALASSGETTPSVTGPTADAGPDQWLNEGTTVILDASGSSGEGLFYSWTQTAGSPVQLSNSESQRPAFGAPEVDAEGEVLTFELTVTDSADRTDTDTVSIRVSNEPQLEADAGPDQEVYEGAAVTLGGSGFFGDIQSYSWTQTAGTSVWLSDPTVPRPTFTAPEVGAKGEVLAFQLTVTYFAVTVGPPVWNTVQITDTDTAYIRVLDLSQFRANAGPDQVIYEVTSVTLDGSRSSGDIESYSWTQTAGTPVGLSDTTSPKPTFVAPEVGIEGEVLTFELTVSDSETTETDTVRIRVIDTSQLKANAGPDQWVDIGATVTLDASGSSGLIQSCSWTQTAGTSVWLSDDTSSRPTFAAPEVGVEGEALDFELTVTDNEHMTDTDTVRIHVNQEKSSSSDNGGGGSCFIATAAPGSGKASYGSNRPGFAMPIVNLAFALGCVILLALVRRAD